MTLKDRLTGLFTLKSSSPQQIQTRELTEYNNRFMRKIVQQIDNLTKKDIHAWIAAWRTAVDVDNPRRASLYDIYNMALIDNHLTGCITQRKGFTMRKDFAIIGKDGKENLEGKMYFQNEWFRTFLDHALDARYWGHSLIELGPIANFGNVDMRYTNCNLIPRKNVLPEFGIFVRDVTDDKAIGYSYRDSEFSRYLIEVGDSKDLGLLLKVTPQSLSKKNMLAYWDVFGELFGMPIRVATTTSQNTADWDNITAQLEAMGAAPWALLPDGTTLDIKESGRGDVFNVYDKRVERCNSEISKAILGQTMTIDNGSSQSQSNVHLEVFQNIVEADALQISYTINNQLIPRMIADGFKLDDCKFVFDNSTSYTPEQQLQIDKMLLEKFEIDPQHFIDKYKVPITGVREGTANFF